MVCEKTNITINDEHPYEIICQAANPCTGFITEFKSKIIYENLGMYNLEKVSVYINPKKPSKYYVDADEAIEKAKKYASI